MNVSSSELLFRAKETCVWVKDIFQWITQLCMLTLPLILLSYVFVLKTLECLIPKWATKLRNSTEMLIVSLFELLSSMFAIFGGKSTKKLLFVPNADQQSPLRWWKRFHGSNESNGFYEISQDALTRYLLSKQTADLIDDLNSDGTSKTFDNQIYQMLSYLKDFQKDSQIIELEVYRSSMHWIFDPLGIYHTFIVFKTISETEGDYWWSLEKNTKNIVIQRSRNKFAVVNRLKRTNRKNAKIISERAIRGKGTMSDLLTTLWAHNVIPEKYHVVKSNCQTFVQFIEKANNQSFVSFVKKRITTVEPNSCPPHQKLEPFINLLLSEFPKWAPLFSIVYLGDPVLLENLLCNTRKYPQHTDVNLVAYDTSLLQLAILFSRTKIVEILLRNPGLKLTTPKNENSEMPWKDMSIFHTAAAFTNDTKIIDLLLKHSEMKNDPDAQGRTALHIAVMESNETTVNHLLKINLIDQNAPDRHGLSPLHLAAQHTDNTKIIDLILQAKNAQQTDRGIDDCDSNGRTALHHAISGFNVTTASHLMKKGANPNHGDKDGRSPLELAAKEAKNMEIIDLLLNDNRVFRELYVKGGDEVFNCATNNEDAGLRNEIEYRLRNQGIIRKKHIPPIDANRGSSTESLAGGDSYRNEERKNGFINKIYDNCSIF